jgi:hypothetical protein
LTLSALNEQTGLVVLEFRQLRIPNIYRLMEHVYILYV